MLRDSIARVTTSDMDQRSYKGNCFCGAIEVVVTGEPVAVGYCHCSSCRRWSAGPVNAFTLWKPEAVRITRGMFRVDTYNRTERSFRKWCTACGGHILTEHPTWGVVDVYAAVLRELQFKPALHVNYGEAVLRMKDGLPKQKDMPKEMGGSGTLVPE